jgi:hypothetical protein
LSRMGTSLPFKSPPKWPNTIRTAVLPVNGVPFRADRLPGYLPRYLPVIGTGRDDLP